MFITGFVELTGLDKGLGVVVAEEREFSLAMRIMQQKLNGVEVQHFARRRPLRINLQSVSREDFERLIEILRE